MSEAGLGRAERLGDDPREGHVFALLSHWDKFAAFGTVLTAFLASVTYSVARHTNDVYAQNLGVTPEALGATQGVLIPIALILAITMVALGMLLLASGVLGAIPSAALMRRALQRRSPMLSRWLRGSWRPNHGLGRWRVLRGLTRLVLGCAPLVFFTALAAFSTRVLPNGTANFLVFATLFSLGTGASIGVADFLWPTSPSTEKWSTATERRIAGCVGAALLAILSVITIGGITALEDGATGRAKLLLSGTIETKSSLTEYLLAGQKSAARVIPLGSTDPLALCDNKRVTRLIASSDSDYLLVVYPERGSAALGVYRVPREAYTVVTGLKRSEPCKIR